MNFRVCHLSLLLIISQFISLIIPLNVYGESSDFGDRSTSKFQSNGNFSVEAAITLACLTDLDSVSEIDKLIALVSQLKTPKNLLKKETYRE